jgi:transcriptional regulator with XRE-family HTH domain
MSLQEIFIANLKKIRKERGLSQMALSEKCDTTSNYIGQIEMGRRIPSFDKIEKIASALHTAPHELFFEPRRETKELSTKDYLMSMPAAIKKDIPAHITNAVLQAASGAFSPDNY